MFVSKYTPQTASCRKSSLSVVVIAAAVFTVGLAGCRGHTGGQYAELRGTVIADPSARHPIAVSKAPVQMDIEVPRGSSGLTRRNHHGSKRSSHGIAAKVRDRLLSLLQVVVATNMRWLMPYQCPERNPRFRHFGPRNKHGTLLRQRQF